MTPTEFILGLISQFPCLESKIRTEACLDRSSQDGGGFDPDRFMRQLAGASDGERLCALFVVNVWNPPYAKSKKWNFDLFNFIGTADVRNKQPVLKWMANPYWP